MLIIDSSSYAVINVYSPKEPHSEAYIIGNLEGLERLKCNLDLMIKFYKKEHRTHDIVYINMCDSDGEYYELVIQHQENIEQFNAPYIEDIKEIVDVTAYEFYKANSYNNTNSYYEYLTWIGNIYFKIKNE